MSIEKILATIPATSRDKRDVMRRNAEAKIVSGDAKAKGDAETLIAALDRQEVEEQGVLIDELKGLPVVERVVRAFTVEPLTETEEKLIRVLLDNPGSTSAELSQKLGWGGMTWHMHFGTMGKNRAIYLWPAPDAVTREGKFFSGILADYDPAGSLFTMKPDVGTAFAKLGLRGAS